MDIVRLLLTPVRLPAPSATRRDGTPRPLTGPWDPPVSKRFQAEAKAVLFSELAMAVEHGVDLVEATAAMGRYERERTAIPATALGKSKGDYRRALINGPTVAQTVWNRMLFYVILPFRLILYCVFVALPQYSLLALALAAERLFHPAPVVRRMARRLHRHVSAGHSLADAVGACPADFSPAEAALVRAAQKGAALATTLRALGARNRHIADAPRYSVLAYFLLYGSFTLAIYFFLEMFIAPKFLDIYAQLGAEMPPVIGLGNFANHFALPATLGCLFTALVFYLGFSLSQIGRYWNLIAIASLGTWLLFGLAVDNEPHLLPALIPVQPVMLVLLVETSLRRAGDFSPGSIAGYLATGALLSAVLLVLLLGTREVIRRWSPLNIARAILGMVSRLPGLRMISGSVDREIELLRVVDAGLEAGLPDSEIAQCVVAGAPAGFRRAAQKFLLATELGVPILRALASSGVLSGNRARRVDCIDVGPGMAPLVRGAIADMEFQQDQTVRRFEEVMKFCGYAVIGVLAAYITVGTYAVLFTLPKVVGH